MQLSEFIDNIGKIGKDKEQIELEKYIELNEEGEKTYYERLIEFLSDACDNKFSDEKVVLLRIC